MKIAVIQGGPSAEAEVSRSSARGVAAALLKAGHEPHRLELAPALCRELLDGGFEVAFPVAHGRFGEDGALQGLLEILGMPYVGTEVSGCAIAMDKIVAKRAFAAAGLPLAQEVVIERDEDLDEACRRARAVLGHAMVVKPASQGSAIGVALLRNGHNDAAVRDAVAHALTLSERVLCERYVRGREVTCAVVDVPSLGGLRAFPPTEIFSKAAEWYDFTSRYATGGSVHQCPANLPPHVFERVQQAACAAHRALGCRDLSRVDFVVGDGAEPDAVTLLEVNVLPGMTATSLYPEAAAAAGLSFDVLCDAMVRNALERSRAHRVVQAVAMPA